MEIGRLDVADVLPERDRKERDRDHPIPSSTRHVAISPHWASTRPRAGAVPPAGAYDRHADLSTPVSLLPLAANGQRAISPTGAVETDGVRLTTS
jgi:hypothetical protein